MPKSSIDQFFEDVEKEILKVLKPEAAAKEAPKPEAEPEGTSEAPVSEADELSVEGLALEAIRVLKKAENTDYVDEAESLLHVTDRYIRLTELAIAANAAL